MTLCINPKCAQPNHPDNDTQSHCPTCGTELIIQGRYRIMRLLTDNSGFGLVYEAFERDKPKILKLLKPSHNKHPKAIQLFEQEALVLSRLDHPGVPSIEPDGCFQITPMRESEPIHCIVMEKIDGPNLSEWMHQQGNHPISEHQALRWLQQLSEVLHLIHQQQYFHRDIKPENIMLRSNGQLVLVDFGAVREVSYTYFEQLESTAGITRISSIGYTAPEQERGKAVPQSDFFSLGCTFLYLLTGKKPLDPDIYDSLTNEFRWRPFAPHISTGLADFIDYLTAARVIDRPPNTLEILACVGKLQDALKRDASTSSRPHTHSQHNDSGASPSHHPRNAAGYQPVSAFPFGNPPIPSDIDSAELEDVATLPPDNTFIGSIPPSANPVPLPSVSVTPPASSDIASDSTLMETMAETTVQQEQATLMQPPPGPRTLNRWPGWIVGGVVLVGGTLMVLAGQTFERPSLDIFRPRSSVPSDAANGSPSPLLAFSTPRTLDGHTAAVNALAISLDQRMLASASDDRTVRLWDLVSGQEIRPLVGHRDRVQAVAISPNGQMIASGGGDNLIKLWNPLTGEAIADLIGHQGPINALTITADGQRLMSASADKTIKIWDLGTYTELKTLNGHSSFVNDLSISPDGTTLASGSADRTIKLWSLNTYQPLETLSGHDSFVNTVLFNLNGNTLISGGADHHINIWDSLTYDIRHTLAEHTSFVNALAITLDGQYLVSTSADQTLGVWDLKTQSKLTSIPWDNTFVDAVAIRVTGATWQILASGRGSSSIRMWNVEKSRLQ